MWEVGANLYLMWADDNGPFGDTAPTREGGWTIDNFSIDPFCDECMAPFSCYPGQPHDVTIETCRSTNLFVSPGGAGPLTYQWFHNGAAIPGANSATLNLWNVQLPDAGVYFVRVTGPGANNTAESDHVAVTVNQDTVQPVVRSAVSLLSRSNVVISFTEPLDPTNAAVLSSYRLHPFAGGPDVDPAAARLNSAGDVLTLGFDAPLPNTDCELVIDTSVTDCSGNPVGGDSNSLGQVTVALQYEVRVISFDDESWKYDFSGVDLGTAWFSPAYDDGSWSNGLSVFDAKNTPRSSVGGRDVVTQLPLHYGNYATDDLPVYYFRKRFFVPLGLAHVKSMSLWTFVDDFDVAYLNGKTEPVHVRPGFGAGIGSYGYSGGTAVGEAGVEGPFDLPVSALVEDMNLIAVKLFQQTALSSDITFAYEIRAVIDSLMHVDRVLTIAYDGANLRLSWENAESVLYEADRADAPAELWRPVGSGGFATMPAAGSARFYTLRR
jgi:hypothetical protein